MLNKQIIMFIDLCIGIYSGLCAFFVLVVKAMVLAQVLQQVFFLIAINNPASLAQLS